MNKNILTYASRAVQVEQTYFAPVSSLPNGQFFATLYTFLSRVDPWNSDIDPEQPTQDWRYIKRVMGSIFVAKKVNSSDICPVIPRVDWTHGSTYFSYSDEVDMFTEDINGFVIKKFYVKNRYDQVFKCLWNNNNGLATAEPIFEPGNFGTNNIYTGSDGYKWIYMYTLGMSSKIKFMDSNWMPITPAPTVPQQYQMNELNGTYPGIGDIEVINVTNGGSGYDTTNSAITVSIVGDGVGASGIAQVTNGIITDIIVTNPGTNYSLANVIISTANSMIGSGATAIAPSSPISGHGNDPLTELGCNHVMITAEFNGGENGYIPTDINYRQVGLVVDPIAHSTLAINTGLSQDNPADASIYKVSTDVVISSGAGSYVSDEIVYQGLTQTEPTFTATVLSFDSSNNVVKLINTTGSVSINTPLTGLTSGTSRTALNTSLPDYIQYSGYITYIENRNGVQRSSDGIEQFKFVLGY